MGCMKMLVKYIVLGTLISTCLAAEQNPIDPGRSSHVVGGESVTGGEFPFVAKIIYYSSRVGCTGSLIAPNRVLTAGHCVVDWSTRTLSVGFGSSRSAGPSFKVTRRIWHPEYSTQEYDIAILEFEPAVSIQPVRVLSFEDELQFAPSGGQGMAVGWGRTVSDDPESLPAMLHKVSVPIYTHTDCRRILDELRDQGKDPQPPSIHELVLCAGQENQAPAHGDSGGPLLVQTPEGWAQVGVLSQATRNSEQTIYYMGQFTRTSSLYDWIYPSDAEDSPETVGIHQLHFAHFGNGDGLATDLLLLNPNLEVASEATAEVFRSDGTLRFPLRRIAAPAAGVVEWTLPASEKLETGSIVVTSRTRFSGILRFRYSAGGATAVSATPLGRGFMVPLSSRSDRTGVAIRNADTEPVTVAISLGSLPKVYRTIPPQGQVAAFVDEYFPGRGKQETDGALLVQTEPPEGVITVLALEFVGDSLVTLPATVLSEGVLKEDTP